MEKYELFYKPYAQFPFQVYKTYIFEEGSSTTFQCEFTSFEEALRYIGNNYSSTMFLQGVKIL